MKRIRLALRRRTVGMSQEVLAEQLGVHPTTIMRWEQGRNGPQPWQRPNLAMALKVSVEELAELLGDTDDQPTPPAIFITIPQGADMRWRTVDSELLIHCQTLTDTYRQLDYQAGSRAVYSDVVTQLSHMLALADSVPSALYQPFVRALGDTSQLAAWLAIDHQNYAAARHYTALALSSAQEGEDPTLNAYTLGLMSYIHLHAERGHDAVRLLAGALRLAENPRLGVDPAVHSWLCEAMGEAQALAGDRAAGATFLHRAEQLYDRVGRSQVPPWLGFFNSSVHVTRLKGRCLVKLGEASNAVVTLEAAITQLPTHYVRERSGTLIDLAAAYLLRKKAIVDPDAAATAALEAWDLALTTGSGRNQRRIRKLLPQFAHYRHRPAVQRLQAALG